MDSEMRTTPELQTIVAHVRDRLPDKGSGLILIDGASGTGKTTLAARLVDAWPRDRDVTVIHMDDLYDGWQGLRAGMRLLADTVVPRLSSGEVTRLPRFDWSRGVYGEGTLLSSAGDVIVEGCGCFVVPPDYQNSARIWLDGEDDIRRERALGRGGEGFEHHWSEWEQQFDTYVREDGPAATASLRVISNR